MAEDKRELPVSWRARASGHCPWSEFFHVFRLLSKFEPNLVKRVLTNVLYYRENYAEIFESFSAL